VLGTWNSGDSEGSITSIDYDGRCIVVHLANGAIDSIDTTDGTTRRVETTTTVRFGRGCRGRDSDDY
jgi:hypothetical protein